MHLNWPFSRCYCTGPTASGHFYMRSSLSPSGLMWWYSGCRSALIRGSFIYSLTGCVKNISIFLSLSLSLGHEEEALVQTPMAKRTQKQIPSFVFDTVSDAETLFFWWIEGFLCLDENHCSNDLKVLTITCHNSQAEAFITLMLVGIYLLCC